jgi:hypothetical protein
MLSTGLSSFIGPPRVRRVLSRAPGHIVGGSDRAAKVAAFDIL